MMQRYVLSPRAQSDVEEIWDYTLQNWSEAQAEIYIRQIKQHIDLVAEQPHLGTECNKIRSGYYKYPTGSHILFYKLIEGGVNIIRILHERMDFPRHL